LSWPVAIALAFGAIMLGAGVLLFVSAHWDGMSPAWRFIAVLVLTGGFHVAGSAVEPRLPGLASTLHGVGTLALGGGVFLAGQIFNLDEHWPGGLMLWAGGAVAGFVVLRDLPQFALAVLLSPAWLVAEWAVATHNVRNRESVQVLASGVFLLALVYFTAAGPGRPDRRRRLLVNLGAIVFLPAAAVLALLAQELGGVFPADTTSGPALQVIGWTVAIGLPLLVAAIARGKEAWPVIIATLWVLALLAIQGAASNVPQYAWWAVFAIGLVSWGVHEARTERINMGAVVFGATVLAFYFSQVMDKLGRSASLVGFGLIFLAGGALLERIRRRLVGQAREVHA
jgi:uncharacterized membrane protein